MDCPDVLKQYLLISLIAELSDAVLTSKQIDEMASRWEAYLQLQYLVNDELLLVIEES